MACRYVNFLPLWKLESSPETALGKSFMRMFFFRPIATKKEIKREKERGAIIQKRASRADVLNQLIS